MAQNYIDSLLGEREKIIMVARQHWFILLSMILFEIILTLIFFVGTIFAALLAQAYLSLGWIIFIGFVLMLLPIASMVRDILIFTNHQFIITNRRVIQISGIINKSTTDSSLEKVNDVKMSQSVLGRMFNYGDIEIMTASELGVNLFRRIERPIRFKTAMLNAKESMDAGIYTHESRGDDIPSLIAGLDKLRQQGTLTEEEFQAKKAELLAKL
ncbi:MAG: PH domain-containing protein [Anaerolineales bacterium]|nr:PH domain-containing protein [Anaerolineales bacterium]